MTLSDIYRESVKHLTNHGCQQPELDTKVLLAHVLGSGTDLKLVTDPTTQVNQDQVQEIESLVIRRAAHEPIAYIIGEKEFWSLPFKVTPETLIPRPDSEVLIEEALKELSDEKEKPLRLLDLGTGSGCLIISLLTELPNATGVAVDISDKALAVAQYNAKQNGVADRVQFLTSNWADAVEGEFDVIISNPPYIPSDTIGTLMPDVQKFEPYLALDGGENGLAPYSTIISVAQEQLKPKGLLIVEHGENQSDPLKKLFENGNFYDTRCVADLKGQLRCLISYKKILGKFN